MKNPMKNLMLCICSLTLAVASATYSRSASSQESAAQPKPEDTEQWEPVPPKVLPGASEAAAPSDAIVLFDGRNLDEWVMANDRMAAALKAKGYHYRYVFSVNAVHVDGKVVNETLPEALLWLWQGYPIK